MAYFRCIAGQSGNKATITVVGSSVLAGLSVTCSDGVTTLTKTFPSSSPYDVVFDVPDAGTWTVSVTVSGTTYTDTVEVVFDYSVDIGVFDLQSWLTAGGVTGTYANLAAVLADEEAVRRLFLVHDAVDYLVGRFVDTNITTIINNDLCAKWINLSDYALDYLSANAAIKTAMDTADKYFYGEWTLMPQVPTMTSNTAPFGEAFSKSHYQSNDAYKAFDGNDTTLADSNGNDPGWYIGYHFVKPICIKQFMVLHRNDVAYATAFKLQASNDGSLYIDLGNYTNDTQGAKQILDVNNNGDYSYYRILVTASHENSYGFYSVQFYAYAPKGNVPVMTSNTAPYGEVIYSTGSSNNSYYAFDKNPSTGWGAGGSSGNWKAAGYIGYKFSNPIKVSEVYIFPLEAGSTASNGTRVKDFTIDISNDGTNWETVYSGQYPQTLASGLYVKISESLRKFALYARCNVSNNWTTGGGNFVTGIQILQFYGREFKISVPIMTSNTAPYGVASASSEYATYKAWKPFANSEWISDASGADQWIGYEFTSDVVVKMAYILNRQSTNNQGIRTYKIQYLDSSNNWSDASDVEEITTNQGSGIGLTTDNYSAKKWRIKCLTNFGDIRVSIKALQFYGLDYSEKEFANDGSKWLYDHGVELETISSYVMSNMSGMASGKIVKESSFIDVDSTASNNCFILCGGEDDLSSYSKVGILYEGVSNSYASSNSSGIRVGTISNGQMSSTTAEVTGISSYAPQKLFLDVSSINSNLGVCMKSYCKRNYLHEMWLES